METKELPLGTQPQTGEAHHALLAIGPQLL